jgi:hypothetical protein
MKYLLAIVIAFATLYAQAQVPTDTVDYEKLLDELEMELDSFGIFSLFDSVLAEAYVPSSEFSFRLGYNSNVTNAGRDFGLDQYGFTPGVSFYHKSGLFADYTGFWNSAFEPNYNLSLLSGGYMGSLGKRTTYTLSYERWFYHVEPSETQTYPNNSVSLSGSYDLKKIWVNLDYSYMFGAATAHRITPSINGYFEIPGFWKVKKITLLPMISMLYGNDNVTVLFNGSLFDELRANEYLRQNLQSEEFATFLQSVNLDNETQNRVRRIQNSQLLSEEQKQRLVRGVYLAQPEVQEYIYSILDEQKVEYGIMNWSFNLPVSISFGNFSSLLSYSYSLPQALPGETFDPQPVNFFSLTFSYRLPLR